MAKTKIRATGVPVPQSREAAADAVARIGEIQRELTRISTDMNDELSAIKAKSEGAAQPLRDECASLTEGLKTWCEAHRAELTGGNRTKTADLGTGKVSWRTLPPKVTLPKDQTGLIERLRGMRLHRFIRTKMEVNRDAILAEPEVGRGVPGIKVGSEGEDFIVEPFAAQLGEAA